MADVRIGRTRRAAVQILALSLVGIGMVVLGAALLVLLPGWIDPNMSNAEASGEAASAVPSVVDFPAPQLELTSLDGQDVALAALQGQVVLVNHWATWCPPCKAEMPVLQAYYDEHRDRGFTIVAIEAGQPVEQVASYVNSAGLTFSVWPDPHKKGMAAFGAQYLPSSYVIDREGRIVLFWSGAISRAMLDQYLTPYLEEVNGSES